MNVCKNMKNISPENLSDIQKVKFEKHKINAELALCPSIHLN